MDFQELLHLEPERLPRGVAGPAATARLHQGLEGAVQLSSNLTDIAVTEHVEIPVSLADPLSVSESSERMFPGDGSFLRLEEDHGNGLVDGRRGFPPNGDAEFDLPPRGTGIFAKHLY